MSWGIGILKRGGIDLWKIVRFFSGGRNCSFFFFIFDDTMFLLGATSCCIARGLRVNVYSLKISQIWI